MDLFELFCQYEHAGDVQRAVREAAQLLEMQSDSAFEYDKEAIDHGAKVAKSIMGDKKSDDDIPEHLLTVPGILNEVVTFLRNHGSKRAAPICSPSGSSIGRRRYGQTLAVVSAELQRIIFH